MEKAYETYKDTQGLWIKKVPLSWQFGKFKHFADILSGYAFKSTDYVPKGGVPIIRIGDIKSKIEPNNAKRANPNNIEDLERFIIKYGDILLAMTGATIGKSATFETNELAYLNQRVGSVRAKNGNLQRYLKYFILTDFFEEFIRLECDGAAQENISSSDIAELEICFPSPQEQTQIATYLDYHTQLIDTLISKKETLIQKLQEQRQAIINEAVTKGLNKNVALKDSGIKWLGDIPEHWEVVKFRYKFETSKGLTITKANLQDEGVPCVNYGEIHSKFGFEVNPEIHNLKCVSEEYLNTNENSLLSKGDFVFADTSEDIEGSGNFTHLHSDIPTFAGYHTIIARLVDNSNYRFFAYFFDSSTFRTQVQNLVKGVKVFSITNKILKDTNLLFPPIEEQKQIADFIDTKTDKIFVSSEKLKTSIQKLKDYRQSLISEAVTGKIDVRDWQQPENKS